MDNNSFNEFSRWQDEIMAHHARRERARKGIDENGYWTDHAIWIVWAFNYENLKTDLAQGHFRIAFQYDDKCKNIAGN